LVDWQEDRKSPAVEGYRFESNSTAAHSNVSLHVSRAM
jgi:hypothetical protein